MENQNAAMFQQLTYDMVEKSMKNGNLALLPDWGGFWFMFSNKTYVFLKEGSFRDTPHEEYKSKENWIATAPDKEVAIRMVKGLRRDLDEVKSCIESFFSSRECSLAKTEVQYAFMWMGNLLGEIGAENPYPQSYNVASPAIEKHADLSDDAILASIIVGMDPTAKVKFLRTRVSMFQDVMQWLFSSVFYMRAQLTPKFQHIAVNTPGVILQHLTNINLWLGQELNNIRIQQEKATLSESDKTKIADAFK